MIFQVRALRLVIQGVQFAAAALEPNVASPIMRYDKRNSNDALAERSKAVAQGAIPKGQGFEPPRRLFYKSPDTRAMSLKSDCASPP